MLIWPVTGSISKAEVLIIKIVVLDQAVIQDIIICEVRCSTAVTGLPIAVPRGASSLTLRVSSRGSETQGACSYLTMAASTG